VTRYWLDASSVIWGNRELFRLDDSPRYWAWLETKMNDGSVVTHKAVYDEIIRGAEAERPDPIAVWTKNRKGIWCSYGCTDESKVLLGEISTYCIKKYSFEVAKNFLAAGDPLLIARAKVDEDGIVVTQESERKDPRIPSICDHFGVLHMPLNRMNIKLGMKWD
jgi:hypothetical protein